MAVQVWIGEKPEHPNERRAIVALANGLDRLEGLYLVLSNFHVGGRTIDMTIIKHDAIFIIELKNCNGKIIGGVNGPWYVEGTHGELKQLNPGRSNPYNQVISCYYSLTNFLNEHRSQIFSAQKARQVNFRTCKRLVVIAPRIPPGSEIVLDWKVELKGLDELPSHLVTEICPEIELTETEMLTIPQLLGCTRWNDINQLIAGLFPGWDFTPSESPRLLASHSESSPSFPPAPAPAPARSSAFFRPFQSVLKTLVGRIALVATVILLALLGILAVHSSDRVLVPEPSRFALTRSLVGPAGGVYGDDQATVSGLPQNRCVWSGFQPIGKQWDETYQQWISVGVESTTVDRSPDVIVTLEQVDFCGKRIILFWSVRNLSQYEATFPLQNGNITIRDPLGNSYPLDDAQSQPKILRVAPGGYERGIAVVPYAVVPNTPSLLVRLKEQPFGESSWLVSLEGNY